MNSSRLPSGSRKYTLVPRPRRPPRVIGPASIATPCLCSCSTAPAIGPSHSKHKSLFPGATGTRATIAGRTPMHIELLLADAVGEALIDLYDLDTEHVSIES